MDNNKDSCANNDICNVRVIHAGKIQKAREKAIPNHQMEQMALIYKLLGDTTRLKILLALKQVELCVCDIAAFLEMTESAVSHQLRRLRDLAIVKRRRQGQILYYTLDDVYVDKLLEIGMANTKE